MKISIFTPTHNPQWLEDAYRSICIQDGMDWEWVIVPSTLGEGSDGVPEAIANDPRVVIHRHNSDYIGRLKRVACEQATGDVLVELDHDDILVPGILAKVAQRAEQGAGFIFSDSAVFHDDRGVRWSFGYDAKHGWENYPFKAYDRYWNTTRAFPVTPRSLCEIFYAPDHVRCWTKAAYWAAGGHDPQLEAADDHDLMCRTYLAGVEFSHINECGYLYRYHGENSFRKKSKALVPAVFSNRAKYLSRLVAEWGRREGYPLVSLDTQGLTGENVGAFVGPNYLDDIPSGELVEFFNEAYQRLAPGGWLFLHADPAQHSEDDFLLVTQRRLAKERPDVQCRFQKLHIREMVNRQPGEPPRLQAVLTALKGQRQPGPVEI